MGKLTRNNDRMNRRFEKRTPRKPAPPETTHAETAYYARQREKMTPMVVVLVGGEELSGAIKWYDRHAIKLLRDGQAELMILKRTIKYLYEDDRVRRSSLVP